MTLNYQIGDWMHDTTYPMDKYGFYRVIEITNPTEEEDFTFIMLENGMDNQTMPLGIEPIPITPETLKIFGFNKESDPPLRRNEIMYRYFWDGQQIQQEITIWVLGNGCLGQIKSGSRHFFGTLEYISDIQYCMRCVHIDKKLELI